MDSWPPRRDWRPMRWHPKEWWRRNRALVLGTVIVIAVIAGIWAAETVPVVSTSLSFAITVPLSKVPDYQIYIGSAFFGGSAGGTVSGTVWAPAGTVETLRIVFGSDSLWLNASSGNFHLTSNEKYANGWVWVETFVPTTIYVNGTQSYLVPLI
jgi:hypothetical protein